MTTRWSFSTPATATVEPAMAEQGAQCTRVLVPSPSRALCLASCPHCDRRELAALRRTRRSVNLLCTKRELVALRRTRRSVNLLCTKASHHKYLQECHFNNFRRSHTVVGVASLHRSLDRVHIGVPVRWSSSTSSFRCRVALLSCSRPLSCSLNNVHMCNSTVCAAWPRYLMYYQTYASIKWLSFCTKLLCVARRHDPWVGNAT
ncbi:uncharacterized protein LOC119325022 [Triticum dicoccoides]|uniref:uncharacterized protein LOC119325022 n=1 Tax=Triticum dicoccoides TaxID=85692 RepID=UPI0018910A0D|nr:uncharacterized protein LOC119325022 [Triticum dicoccoides]